MAGAAFCPGLTAVAQEAKSPNLPIAVEPSSIAYLMADEGQRSPSLLVKTDESNGFIKRFWVENWRLPEETIEWRVLARQAGRYEATLMIDAPPGSKVQLEGPVNKIQVACEAAHPQYFHLNWNRIAIPAPLGLPAGRSVIRIRLLAPVTVGRFGAALKSVELLNAVERPSMDARVKEFRADTSWLSAAKFGFMCQCGEWSFPRHGPRKPWPSMAEQFNVEQYADLVASTGSGFAVWSATWATYYFPAPIKAIDRILPGRTSKRDLIGDIADALAKRNIRLILYYHAGHSDKDWWARNWVSPFDKRLFLDNWCAIISEVGARYGDRLAGWMFDDDLLYYPAPYERLGHAAKTGSGERIISWNPWIQPRGTDFQDFQFGEGFKGSRDLPASAMGIWPEGPMRGLHAFGNFQVDGPDWGIDKAETVIDPPLLSSDRGLSIALDAAARDEALSWNLLMYDDGSVSEASLDLFRTVGAAVRKQYPKPRL